MRIAVWNANGLSQHKNEVEIFIKNQNIDIMLISETHFTDKSYICIPSFKVYFTNHPAGTARGGTAIIIKNSIKHQIEDKFEKMHIQATTITIYLQKVPLTISSVYCPPKHSITKEQYEEFFNSLGNRFIAGGDYNAKHTQWGSRILNPKGRVLLKTIQSSNLKYLSTGEPTYWPADPKKKPDVIDFCVLKGIPSNFINAVSCIDLSSDHSPIIVTLNSMPIQKEKRPSLHNKKTNWDLFKEIIDNNLNTHLPLKSSNDIESAVLNFTKIVQQAAWSSTPSTKVKTTHSPDLNHEIQNLIQQKRKLRRVWQKTRYPADKANLNKATTNLKEALKDLKSVQLEKYLQSLTATEATNYSLWKATKKLNQPTSHIPPILMENGKRARNDKEKADTFAKHLCNVFTPFSNNSTQSDDRCIYEFIESPYQMDMPIARFTQKEVHRTILEHINPKKAPGYDLITGKILRELPETGIKYLTQLNNAILRICYVPLQWKVAQIIPVQKPGKPSELVTSFRPISLLPIAAKLFEKLLLTRLKPIMKLTNIIPNHQFGFREMHATTEQVHRVYKVIRDALERKEFCTSAYLDITQAFDKVWHPGLLYKLKKLLPHTYYELIKSYLEQRHFLVKFNEEQTPLYTIEAGVPQGSVLGPTLYTLFTADLPLSNNTTTATFADDTVIMATNSDPKVASRYLQQHLDIIEKWLQTWRIKANTTKSVQVTYTLKKTTCPPVSFNNQLLPQSDDAKYLGLYIDRRLTWQKHIFTKRKQLGLKLTSLYWLMGRNSKLSVDNKLLIYKSIFKPIWTYGIELWGSASKTNIEIIQRFQTKVLRMVTNAPWYVSNEILHRDLKIPTVQQEIKNFSLSYKKRLLMHPNQLAINLLATGGDIRRLKRLTPTDLA